MRHGAPPVLNNRRAVAHEVSAPEMRKQIRRWLFDESIESDPIDS